MLATSGTQRSRFFPNAPTFTEQRIGNIVITEWFGLFMPAKTPAATVERAAEVVRAALTTPEMADKFATFGMVTAPATPAEFARRVKAEHDYWGPVVRSTGFKPTT